MDNVFPIRPKPRVITIDETQYPRGTVVKIRVARLDALQDTILYATVEGFPDGTGPRFYLLDSLRTHATGAQYGWVIEPLYHIDELFSQGTALCRWKEIAMDSLVRLIEPEDLLCLSVLDMIRMVEDLRASMPQSEDAIDKIVSKARFDHEEARRFIWGPLYTEVPRPY